jgi:hypothetical protein
MQFCTRGQNVLCAAMTSNSGELDGLRMSWIAAAWRQSKELGRKSIDPVGETTGGARGILSNLKQFPKRFFGFWRSCCELATMTRQIASPIPVANAQYSEINPDRANERTIRFHSIPPGLAPTTAIPVVHARRGSSQSRNGSPDAQRGYGTPEYSSLPTRSLSLKGRRVDL